MNLEEFCTHFPAYASQAAAKWQDMQARVAAHRDRSTSPLRMLEIGCGAQYPYTVLFHSDGVKVVGLDIVPLVRRDIRGAKYAAILRGQGALHTLRRLASDVLFHRAFYRPLGHAAGVRIRHAGTPLVRMDAANSGFAAGSFDLVYSSACFEHLPDVDGTMVEIGRVLKPGGIAEIEIHLFASMTGGHEPDLYSHCAPPAGFPLWGHLLDAGWTPSLFLNRWRDRQFRDVFAKHFEILDRRVTSRHGQQYLTKDIEARLAAQYSADELTTESVLYVLRKSEAVEKAV